MLELSRTDELTCDQYLKKGIFTKIDPKKIRQTDGAISVLCSDCDRFHGAMEDIWTLSRAWRNDPRTHVFALNGGALWLADDPFASAPSVAADIASNDSPLEGMEKMRLRFVIGDNRFVIGGNHIVFQFKTEHMVNAMVSPTLLLHIKQAEQMKGIETLLLNVHAPCGVANHFSWNLETTTARVVAAADVVRRRVAGEQSLPIIPICRVLRGDLEVPFLVDRERFLAQNRR